MTQQLHSSSSASSSTTTKSASSSTTTTSSTHIKLLLPGYGKAVALNATVAAPLACVICHTLTFDPASCPACHSLTCRKCIYSASPKLSSCPSCSSTLSSPSSSTTVPFIVRITLDVLRVRCMCGFQCEARDLLEHVRQHCDFSHPKTVEWRRVVDADKKLLSRLRDMKQRPKIKDSNGSGTNLNKQRTVQIMEEGDVASRPSPPISSLPAPPAMCTASCASVADDDTKNTLFQPTALRRESSIRSKKSPVINTKQQQQQQDDDTTTSPQLPFTLTRRRSIADLMSEGGGDAPAAPCSGPMVLYEKQFQSDNFYLGAVARRPFVVEMSRSSCNVGHLCINDW
eukprot:PhM_4_TR5050/c0_g1_i1/m.44287